MWIPIIRGTSPKKMAEKIGIDFDAWLPKLSKLKEDEQIIAIFVADTSRSNPIRILSVEDKVKSLCDVFAFEYKMCDKLVKKCYEMGSNMYEACIEYKKYTPDPIADMEAAISHQARSISHQLLGLTINLSKLDDETKVQLEQVLKFTKETNSIGNTLKNFESMLNNETDEAVVKPFAERKYTSPLG